MTTTQNQAVIAELTTLLMNSSNQFDMGTIEAAVSGAMLHHELKFRPSEELVELEVIDEGEWDSTEEYFYDRINTTNISAERIGNLVGLCTINL